MSRTYEEMSKEEVITIAKALNTVVNGLHHNDGITVCDGGAGAVKALIECFGFYRINEEVQRYKGVANQEHV